MNSEFKAFLHFSTSIKTLSSYRLQIQPYYSHLNIMQIFHTKTPPHIGGAILYMILFLDYPEASIPARFSLSPCLLPVHQLAYPSSEFLAWSALQFLLHERRKSRL